MIEGENPLLQSFLGGLMTWGLTALGAATAFLFRTQNNKVLGWLYFGIIEYMISIKTEISDSSLGFASGVMIAASFWSLLAPGIEKAEAQMRGADVCFDILVKG